MEEDPALIGGFQIQVGDQVLDTSVASKLGLAPCAEDRKSAV